MPPYILSLNPYMVFVSQILEGFWSYGPDGQGLTRFITNIARQFITWIAGYIHYGLLYQVSQKIGFTVSLCDEKLKTNRNTEFFLEGPKQRVPNISGPKQVRTAT